MSGTGKSDCRGLEQPGDNMPQTLEVPENAQCTREVKPDSTLLFRYSALTFNGHRIHYDLDFCRQEEGYPGLVVHGPLTATLLIQMARHHNPGKPIGRCEFRAYSPPVRQCTVHTEWQDGSNRYHVMGCQSAGSPGDESDRELCGLINGYRKLPPEDDWRIECCHGGQFAAINLDFNQAGMRNRTLG